MSGSVHSYTQVIISVDFSFYKLMEMLTCWISLLGYFVFTLFTADNRGKCLWAFKVLRNVFDQTDLDLSLCIFYVFILWLDFWMNVTTLFWGVTKRKSISHNILGSLSASCGFYWQITSTIRCFLRYGLPLDKFFSLFFFQFQIEAQFGNRIASL